MKAKIMSKKNITLHAILTTLSPLTISSPESFRYEVSDSTGYGMVKHGTTGGIACAGIQRRRFQENAVAGVDFGVPLIAANNIAGRLRREAANIVKNVLKENSQKVLIQTFSAITNGSVTGKPDTRDSTLAEYRASSTHPLVGLLGGGPRMFPRRLRVLDALPVMSALREAGFSINHPNNSGRESSSNLTSAACFRKCDDISALLDVDLMESTIENFEEAFEARQLLILQDKKDKDNGEKGNRTSTKAWSAFEFVNPGVDFDFTLEMTNVTDAQIGLLLESLDQFAKTLIGGQTRNGLGRIKLQDVVLADSTGDTSFDGTSIFNNNSLIRSHRDVVPFLSAWNDAKVTITGADLDAMFKLPVDSEDEKKAKALEKAAKAEAKKAAKASKEVKETV